MNRQAIIDTSDCPTCGAAAGQKCKTGTGADRTKSHVERLYRAQDALNGKPDRVTGEAGWVAMADRRCPICRKLLSTTAGAVQHAIDAHGMKRHEVQWSRAAFIKANEELRGKQPAPEVNDDGFDLIDEGDA